MPKCLNNHDNSKKHNHFFYDFFHDEVLWMQWAIGNYVAVVTTSWKKATIKGCNRTLRYDFYILPFLQV